MSGLPALLPSLAAAGRPNAALLQGPAGVFAVVLLEVALGSLMLLWVTPVWGVVKRGFFVLMASTIATCALLSLLSANGGLSRTGGGGSARLALGLFTAASAGFLGALLAKRLPVARAIGIAAVPLGVWAVLAVAALRGDTGDTVRGALAMLCGAAFLGASWHGMVLGHWYLVDRKLSARPMKVASYAFTASIALALVSALVGRGQQPDDESALRTSALLLVHDLELYLALGLVAVCALLAFFVHKLVAEGSIRAATGMLYLAVIMAFSAEFAAKVYFFST